MADVPDELTKKIETFLAEQGERPEMQKSDGSLLDVHLRTTGIMSQDSPPVTQVEFYSQGKLVEAWQLPLKGQALRVFARTPERTLTTSEIEATFGKEFVPEGKLEWAVEDFIEEQAERMDWPYDDDDDLICRKPLSGKDTANVQLTLADGSYEFWSVPAEGPATCVWAHGVFQERAPAPLEPTSSLQTPGAAGSIEPDGLSQEM